MHLYSTKYIRKTTTQEKKPEVYIDRVNMKTGWNFVRNVVTLNFHESLNKL